MSRIPDVRNPFEEELYQNTKGAHSEPQPNAYYQGLLNEQDASQLFGFDYAIDTTVRNFFFNLDISMDDLEECGFDYNRLHRFNEHYVDYLKALDDGDDFDFESITDTQIRLLLIVIDGQFEYAESERDMLGTSLIDSMDDEEYAECTDKYKAGYKNILLRAEEEQRAEEKAEQDNNI